MTEETDIEIKDSGIWKNIGNHGARLTIVEANDIQHRQSILNLRAELTGIVAEHRNETNNYIHRMEEKMEVMWDSVSRQLSTLKKFQWTIVIGGSVVATMVTGTAFITWQILTNHDRLTWIWR